MSDETDEDEKGEWQGNVDPADANEYYQRHLSEKGQELLDAHTQEELCQQICRRAAFRFKGKRSIRKEVVNAVHAYLFGSPAVPYMAVHRQDHPDYEDAQTIRQMVADRIGWCVPDPEDVHPEAGWPPFDRDGDRFTSYGLAEILAEMKERGDQRPWAVGRGNVKTDEELLEEARKEA